MKPENVILTLTYLTHGNWDKTYNMIENREYVPEKQYWETPKLIKYNHLCLTDDGYPQHFKQMYAPTFAIFYQGDLSLLTSQDPRIGILVHDTIYTKQVHQILEQVPDAILVSTLHTAGEWDIQNCNSHRAIIILDKSFEELNQQEQKLCDRVIQQGGLIITEAPNTPSDTVPQYDYRLLGGVCTFVLAIQVQQEDMFAVQTIIQGPADFGCLPHDIQDNNYCNKLIHLGAPCFDNIQAVVEHLQQ